MSVSDNIKAIRNKKGLAQAEIARRLEIEPSSYHRLENRGDKMTLEQVDSIAKALGINRIELLTWEEEPVSRKENNEQTTARIAELEDRLRDKNKLIERLEWLELELENSKGIIDDYLSYIVDREAIMNNIGQVELHYESPERVLTIPMETYNESLKGVNEIEETYHSYGILLSDEEIKNIITNLLSNEQFRELIAHFRRTGMVHDEAINKYYEAYVNMRYKIPKRKIQM